MIVGTTLMSIGIYFFKFPNSVSTGGTDIVAMLLKNHVKSIDAKSFVVMCNTIEIIGKGF